MPRSTTLVALFLLSAALEGLHGSVPALALPSTTGDGPGGGGASVDGGAGIFGDWKPWPAKATKPYASFAEDWPDLGSSQGFSIESLFDPLFHQPKSPGIALQSIRDILAKVDRDQNSTPGKQALIEQLVTVDKGRSGDPDIPDVCVARVKEGLLAYPRSFLCLLTKNRCQVYVAPFVIRADPSLEGMIPASYAAGSTFLNCRAVFTMKGILIGSHFYRDGKLLPSLDPFHGVQHEMAHAIDHYLGRPSLSKEFLTMYVQERDAISLVDRWPLAYYLNGDTSGAIETFGQLLAHKYCHFTEHHTLALVRCFPRCVKFIDGIFPAAEATAEENRTNSYSGPDKAANEAAPTANDQAKNVVKPAKAKAGPGEDPDSY